MCLLVCLFVYLCCMCAKKGGRSGSFFYGGVLRLSKEQNQKISVSIFAIAITIFIYFSFFTSKVFTILDQNYELSSHHSM